MRHIKVELDSEITLDDCPDSSLPVLIDKLTMCLNEVPVEYKNRVMIEFHFWEQYGSGGCDGKMYYMRPETEEDIADYKQKQQAIKLEGLKNMRKEYERLKLALGEE